MELDNREIRDIVFEDLPVSEFWSTSDAKEDKMHKIHSYPAKFPAFLISKSIEYAEVRNITTERIGDIFCGCGTTALETTKLNKKFYGWDINPVATLIARVKSSYYQKGRLDKYFQKIKWEFKNTKKEANAYYKNHERIKYWFPDKQTDELYTLLKAILEQVPKGKYQDFFLCGFSNILKGCSRWLTKSIKPQVDPDKEPKLPFKAFESQFHSMIKALSEMDFSEGRKFEPQIKTQNFLKINEGQILLDLIVTSPPYVTSYEYADLHQLSTLWLGHVEDYRDLREGTIGSMYHDEKPDNFSCINKVGQEIVSQLKINSKRKAQSVGKYFIDMKKTVEKSYSITKNGGMNIFVIGNTAYKGVQVDNAKFLAETMSEQGFKGIEVDKRKVGSKILTPYRDEKGRFSSDSNDRKVYNYEFIISGRKQN